MPGTINPNASHIWDEAEVWVIPRADVPNDDISSFLPTALDADLDTLGWLFVGLLDEEAGIPFNPELEITHYDGLGHPRYRSKAKKGALSTGFTALEDNDVTRLFILPGSAPDKVGAPRGTYFWVLYKAVDEDIAIDLRVTTRPALFEITNMSGFQSGQENAEVAVHHANDANKDVFSRVLGDIEISTNSIPSGTVGTPFSHQLTSTGGTGSKTWTKTGTLPAGLTLSTAGLLSGTPSAAGTPSITFKVTDSASPTPNEATKTLTVTVTA
ncbi:Ig domain-containing protein [Gordonia sp. ABSL11-1]|uniref:Ig domain-containing protein n=1 Tax=Gordonia sp. ABSL11-1 TaxID=3053924 RepID=UPI00257373BF|nr:Ig domain-containing protein [Gordonia sp. ABSL11-1]MDL9944177.1 Ig domain-containing protein [Gordonia sp. ABSL11-1]